MDSETSPRDREDRREPTHPGNEDSTPRLVVGLGASAGGLDALQRFFSRIKKGTGIAWVVVQHLDPNRETMMPEILGRQVPLEVLQVSDETPLEPDRIYAIPPNATLTLEGGVLRTAEPEEERGRRVPIDIFFSSLAEELGPYAVCVVLSGAGSDGAAGLRRVKELGGMVIAQSPDTARYDGMPRSAASTGLVDYVLPPEAIFDVIVEYANHLEALEREGGLERLQHQADGQIQQINALLHARTGHDFSGYKRSTLSRRIQRRVQVTRCGSVGEYIDRLRREGEEIKHLLRDLLIGVTRFFRDTEAFEALRRQVLPSLIDLDEPEVRVWVPGCATGKEAYSLAILLCETMDEKGVRSRVQVFATDIDQEALAVARAGRYGTEIEGEVSPERLEKFFHRRPNGWEVRPAIREMCVFSPHNLVNDPPFSRLDLISCRNLLIYLHKELQEEIFGLFHFALRPGRYLFLGPSEHTTGAADLFQVLDKKQRIFRARERTARRPVHLPALEPWRRTQMFRRRSPRPSEPRLETRIRRLVLERYSPVAVLVDQDNQVLLATGSTGRYLELPTGEASLDLLELASPGLRSQLRPLLRQARIEGEAKSDAVIERDGGLVPLRLRATRVESEGDDPLWLVLFEEREDRRIASEGAEGPLPEAEPEVVEQLRTELRFVEEQLQSTVEELETSNEELKSSNEELLSMNEELQSTNEELQTSEEELQSRNEELETVNYELQKKIEELNRAHADLQNLFESTAVATLFLDRRLTIQRFTPACEELFRLRPGDAGRHLGDITARFQDVELLDEARAVLESLEPRHRRVSTEGGRWFQLRIRPYTTLEDEVKGVVLTFAEVTELLASQGRERELAAAVDSSRDAIYLRGVDGTIRTWNPAAADLYGFTEKEAVGMSFMELVPPDRHAELHGWEAQVRGGTPVGPVDTRRATRAGGTVDVSLTLSPVRGGDGEIAAIVAVARDVSDRIREQAEKERLAAELSERVEQLAAADARKDEFLAMLSHELRNPLAPLFSALPLLRHGDLDETRRHELLDMIERQGRQLARLVDDLLDVSRITRGKIQLRREVVDLRRIVAEAIETHRPQLDRLDQPVQISLPDDEVWVDGDAVRLQQIVGNLVHNASKFSPPRSTVDVEVTRSGNEAWIEVTDEGIGLEEKVREGMFELFAQGDRSLARSEGGLGVGLTTVKRLVEMHGGMITAESEGPGRGSVFRVRLPLTLAPGAEPPDAEAGSPIRPERILLVEDNADAADALSELLRRSGHECWVARDGVEALERFSEHEPHVVLLDIGLPRMDGFEVAEKIRRTPAGCRTLLVALTGYGQEKLVERALANGFDHHLLKPTEPAAIERLLEKETPPDPI